MPGRASRILLWLFVINLGIALGAGLYEGRVVVPHWLSAGPGGDLHWNAEAARRDDTGLKFWVFTTTVPLTLLTLANLIGQVVALTIRSAGDYDARLIARIDGGRTS